MLSRVNMSNCKPYHTPPVGFPIFTSTAGTCMPLSDSSLYRSTVGAMQHVCYTRPDISYRINRISSFFHRPTEAHWATVKKVLIYLKGYPNHGLMFRPSLSLDLVGFTDSDWGAVVANRRSTRGLNLFFGGNPFVLCSKRQIVAL